MWSRRCSVRLQARCVVMQDSACPRVTADSVWSRCPCHRSRGAQDGGPGLVADESSTRLEYKFGLTGRDEPLTSMIAVRLSSRLPHALAYPGILN